METEIEKGIGKGIGGEGISRAPSTSASETVNEEQQSRQEQSQDEDANLVWWDGEDDPENPMNWSTKKKWSNLGLMSCVTFIT